MKKNSGSFLLFVFFLVQSLAAQADQGVQDTLPNGGAWALVEIENGDTTYIMSLPPVRIGAKRNFKDQKEQRQYYSYIKAARNVWPFAVRAIDLYNEIQVETEDMGKWKRRRHIKKEHKELKEDFTDRLKNLSRTEGKVLIKMIERQTGKSFYTVIRETKGGATAMFWNTMAKTYDYDLKNGYRKGEDTLLDEVLIDYDFGEAIWRNQ